MQKPTTILLFFIIISFFAFFLFQYSPFTLVQSVLQSFFSPFKVNVYTIKTEIADSADSQRKQEKVLAEKLVDYEKLKKDNEALRSQFETSPVSPQKLLPARVIGFLGSFDKPHTLLIDKGEYDGVVRGMPVIYTKNLVGEIISVSPHISHVMLVTNSSFRTVGKGNENNATGVVVGANDFIIFDRVVITDIVKKDEVIVTKGEANNFGIVIPADIIVGKVKSINKQETKPFQNALLESLLDFSNLSTVFIMKE